MDLIAKPIVVISLTRTCNQVLYTSYCQEMYSMGAAIYILPFLCAKIHRSRRPGTKNKLTLKQVSSSRAAQGIIKDFLPCFHTQPSQGGPNEQTTINSPSVFLAEVHIYEALSLPQRIIFCGKSRKICLIFVKTNKFQKIFLFLHF